MKKKENVCVFYLIIIIFEGEIDIRERNIGVCGDAYMQGEKLFNIYIIKCEFYTLIYVRVSIAQRPFFTHTHTHSLSIFLTFSCSSPIFFFTLVTIICIIIVHRFIAVNISNNTFFL